MTLTPTPAAPSGEQIRFRFFKNLVEAERRKVFEVFGVIPEGSKDRLNHSIEALLLKRMLKGFRAAVSQAAPEQANEPVMADGTTKLSDYLESAVPEIEIGDDWTKGYEECKRRLFNIVGHQLRALAAPSGAPTDTELQRVTHERDMLATAIRDAAVKAGIASADACLTGPHLIMFCENMAECILAPSGAPKQQPIGFVTRDTLAKLSGPDLAADESVRLWHAANPPSRAVIPVYADSAASAVQSGPVLPDYVPLSKDGMSVWIEGVGGVDLLYPAAQSTPVQAAWESLGNFAEKLVPDTPVQVEGQQEPQAHVMPPFGAPAGQHSEEIVGGVAARWGQLLAEKHSVDAARGFAQGIEYYVADGIRRAVTELDRNQHESDELGRLRALLNTPELHDFAKGVVLEAAHQQERWSTSHDSGKAPADWFWLIGYLAQKAMTSQMAGDNDKALHHTISTAAAMANWHAAILGKTTMRPGIAPPEQPQSAGSARQGGEHAPEIAQAVALPVAAAPEQCQRCWNTRLIDDPHDIEHGRIACPSCKAAAPEQKP